jgi:hypothetical protein
MQPLDASLETSQQNNNPANSAAGSKPAVTGAPAEAKAKPGLRELFSLSDEGVIRENDDSESEDPNAPVDSLDRAIKKLGITAEQAYKIKVPMPDGVEPMTLGTLKDRVGEVAELEYRELQFDQRRRDSEGELLRAQNEIRELMQLIPREQLKPELIDKVRKQHNATMTRERQLTLEHIPEWRDEEKRVAELEGMTELVQEYGFPAEFVSTVVDHRALKMLRDFYRMDKRIRAALANVETPNSRSQRPSGKNGKGPQNPGKSPSNSNRRNGAVPTQRQRIDALFNKSE